jgi:hypothetical protein
LLIIQGKARQAYKSRRLFCSISYLFINRFYTDICYLIKGTVINGEFILYKRLNLIFLLSVILLLSGCKEETESHYSEQNFKIDGVLDEWTNYPLLTIEDQLVSLGIRNDNDNLYLMLATRSERMVRTFQNHGLTLWLNADNKKNKEFGLVVYPDFDLPDRDEQSMAEKRISPEMLEKINKRRQEMIGKTEILIGPNRITLTSDDGTVATGYGFYKGVYLIELKIPFGPYDLIDNAYTFQPDDKITVGFMSGMDREQMKETMKNNDSGERSGKGRGGMGGRGGGMSGRGGGMRDTSNQRKIQFNNLELWLSIKLGKQIQS